MSKPRIDFVKVITDIKSVGRNNKEGMSSILYRYNIPKIESLERRVLDYIFSVDEDELRFKFIDMIAEANNLPIIHECYFVIYSGVPKYEYVTNQVKNLGSSRSSLSIKYDLCIRIIENSAFLQERQKAINDYKAHTFDDNCSGGMIVRSRKYRKRRARYID